jgi:hypothetical protein
MAELCGSGGDGGGDNSGSAPLSLLLPPPSPSFMRAFSRRASVAMLGGGGSGAGSANASTPASSAELAALAQALASLRWRPSDGWFAAYCAAAETALPTSADRGRKGLEDCATVLHALARLGAALKPSFVRAVAAAARRRFFFIWGVDEMEEVEGQGDADEQHQQEGGLKGGGMRRAAAVAAAAAERRRAREEAGAASAALALSRLAWSLAQYSPGARPRAAAAWWRDFYAAWGGGGGGGGSASRRQSDAPQPSRRRSLLLWRCASPRALSMLLVGVADALHPSAREVTPAPLPPQQWVDEGLAPALARCFRAAAARPAVAAAAAEAPRSRRAAALALAEYLGGDLGAYLRQIEEDGDGDDEDNDRAFEWVASLLLGAAGVV